MLHVPECILLHRSAHNDVGELLSAEADFFSLSSSIPGSHELQIMSNLLLKAEVDAGCLRFFPGLQ